MENNIITKEIDELIKSLDDTFILLNEKCVEFTYEYESYIKTAEYDGSILRQKMKEAVIQAVPNDI